MSLRHPEQVVLLVTPEEMIFDGGAADCNFRGGENTNKDYLTSDFPSFQNVIITTKLDLLERLGKAAKPQSSS